MYNLIFDIFTLDVKINMSGFVVMKFFNYCYQLNCGSKNINLR